MAVVVSPDSSVRDKLRQSSWVLTNVYKDFTDSVFSEHKWNEKKKHLFLYHPQQLQNSCCSLTDFITKLSSCLHLELDANSWEMTVKRHSSGCSTCIFKAETLKFYRTKTSIHRLFKVSKRKKKTSLVAQWVRIRLPMQGTRVWSLVRDAAGQLSPLYHDYWSLCTQAPVLFNKRSHSNEKPGHRNERVAPACSN